MKRAFLFFSVAVGSFASSVASAGAITLETAMARTLEKNPAILEAKLELEQAVGRRLVLHAVTWPDARVQIPGVSVEGAELRCHRFDDMRMTVSDAGHVVVGVQILAPVGIV
jgi:hypothetical protein